MDLPLLLLLALTLLGVMGMEVFLQYRRRKAQRLQNYLWDEAQASIRARINDPQRVTSVTRVRERQPAQQVFLDMICRSTATALKSPRSVITLVDADSQTFIAHHITDDDPHAKEAWGMHGIPLSSTYCQFTIASAQTLVIQNARLDPLVKDNPCTTQLGMKAYLGTPVCSKEGFPVGSLCVFEFTPRKWTRRDIATIESFAALVSL